MFRRRDDVQFRNNGSIQANCEVISFKERMKNLGLKELVMAEVKRPVYHREVHGRERGQAKKFEKEIQFLNKQ